MEEVVQVLVFVVLIYLAIGMLFSIFFYRKGMARIDDATKDSTLGFKIIVFPGIVVFWPLLLLKWIKQN